MATLSWWKPVHWWVIGWTFIIFLFYTSKQENSRDINLAEQANYSEITSICLAKVIINGYMQMFIKWQQQRRIRNSILYLVSTDIQMKHDVTVRSFPKILEYSCGIWDVGKTNFKTTVPLFLENKLYLWLKLILINNDDIFTNLGNLFLWLLSPKRLRQNSARILVQRAAVCLLHFS